MDANGKQMTKAEHDRQLVVRLAHHFPATSWGDGGKTLDLDVAASFLDLHSPEVATLIAAGLLAGKVELIQDSEAFGDVDGTALLQFFEAHGEAWALARLQRTMEKLRDDIARAEVRTRALEGANEEAAAPKAIEFLSAAVPPRPSVECAESPPSDLTQGEGVAA